MFKENLPNFDEIKRNEKSELSLTQISITKLTLKLNPKLWSMKKMIKTTKCLESIFFLP